MKKQLPSIIYVKITSKEKPTYWYNVGEIHVVFNRVYFKGDLIFFVTRENRAHIIPIKACEILAMV